MGRAVVVHADTIGTMVKHLKDNGRLELVPIGHWSSRFAEGARVTLFTDEGSFRGSILPLKASGHTFNEEVDTQPVGWPHIEVRIDADCYDRASTEALGIQSHRLASPILALAVMPSTAVCVSRLRYWP